VSDTRQSQLQSQTDTTGTDDAPLGPYVSTLPGPLGWIDNTIARIEAILLATGVLLLAANTIANVLGRFVFQNSIFFSEELNRVLIIMITFAGISYAARHGRHIRMSALFDALPPRPRKMMMVVISLVWHWPGTPCTTSRRRPDAVAYCPHCRSLSGGRWSGFRWAFS